MAHLKHGVLPENLRPDIVNLILRGEQNLEKNIEDKAPQMAMTVPVMKVLKFLLTRLNCMHEMKQLVWVVACIAFHGSF